MTNHDEADLLARTLERTTRALKQALAERDAARAETADALRLADALRESLRVAADRLCVSFCVRMVGGRDARHTDACVKRTRVLAGDLS